MSSYELNEKKQAVITVEIDGDSFEKAVETAYRKTASRYVVPGFRKGKAPRRIVEKYYGEAVFFEDAFNEAFPDAYEKAIDELKLVPVSRPDIELSDIREDKTVVFKATVDLKPEVTLGKYTGIKIKKNEYTVSDEDVEKELKAAQERASRMVEVERPVQNGDTVTLNYSGSVDGVAFPGGTAENQKLVIGSGSFIPGFEEQMVGMVKGEERNLNVKFPEDYHAEDLKGKDAVFAVKVLEIQKKQLPALDDEFAKDVSEFDTLEEYKKDIAAKQQERNDQRAQTEFENALIDKICQEATVDIPHSMIHRQLDYQIRDMEMRLNYQGLKMEDYLKYTGTTMDQLRAMYHEDAEATVKRQLVIEAIRNAENITADEEGVEKEIARYAEMMKKDPAEYKATLSADELDYITESVAVNKTLDFIKANNKPAAKRAASKKTPEEPAPEEAKEEQPAAKRTSTRKKAAAEEETQAEKPAVKRAPAKKKTVKAEAEKQD